MHKVNRFEFESSERHRIDPASEAEKSRYRDQCLSMFRTVMMPAVIYKGRTFERRVLA